MERSVDVAVLLLLALSAGYYWYVASAGTWTRWPGYHTNYYDLAAEGFRMGRLHLSIEPPPGLLAQANPLDPAHRALWLWDATLYRGHFYIYWGPVPALFLMVVKVVLRIKGEVGDQYLVAPFVFARLVAGTVLLLAMARRFLPAHRRWAVIPAVAALAAAAPTPFLIARSAIYEAAIAAGQCFLLAGVACAYRAVVLPPERKATRWLLAAGAMFALALGSRISLVFCVSLLTLGAAWYRARIEGGGWRRSLGSLIPIATPLAAGGFLLGLYNFLRFDSWTEFGTNHQMTTMAYGADRSYLLANSFSYLFRPLQTACQFPFLVAPWDDQANAFPSWFKMPAGYYLGEPVAGIFRSVPWAWLIVVLLGLALRRVLFRRTGEDRDPAWGFCVFAFSTCALAPSILYIAMWMSSMRYLYDLSSGVLLLATLGGWTLVRRAGGRGSLAGAGIAIVLLATVTVFAGISLGYKGYSSHFETHNPDLWSRLLKKQLVFCRSLTKEAPGEP